MKATLVATQSHIKNCLIHLIINYFHSGCLYFSVNSCLQPKKVGPCKAAFPRFFYNQETEQCESFIWGGCQANGNNFKNMFQCKKKCLSQGMHKLFQRDRYIFLNYLWWQQEITYYNILPYMYVTTVELQWLELWWLIHLGWLALSSFSLHVIYA